MAVTYGFYNSKNGDRKYDAEDISQMFDGLITDGVIGSYGKTFAVTAGEGETVKVDTGRAWFNHTWTLNDAIVIIPCPASEVLRDRYDAVVLEVNANAEIRENQIKIIKGTPSNTPVKPEMTSTEHLHQYPLAYILRTAGSTSISQSQIENTVGTSACPLVTGVLKSMSADQIIAQWDSEFRKWFDSERTILDGDVAANLSSKIDRLKTYNFTLLASGWSSSAPYTQRVAVSGVTKDTNMGPMYFEPTGDSTTDSNLQNALELLSYGITESGYVTIVCYDGKPSVDITVLADGRL